MIQTRTQTNAITRQKIRDARDRMKVANFALAAATDIDEIAEHSESVKSWQDEIDRLEMKLTAWR